MTKNKATPLTFWCTGPSMLPTIRSGDCVCVEQCSCDEYLIGDIIVFKDSCDQTVIHRIISTKNDEFSTRGDNNSRPDSLSITFQSISGRVTSIKGRYFFTLLQKNSIFRQLYCRIIYLLRSLINFIIDTFHPLYMITSQLSWPKKIFNYFMRPTLIYFEKPEGTEIHIVTRNNTIGRYLPNQKCWIIKKPYRFFVDEQALPNSEITLCNNS